MQVQKLLNAINWRLMKCNSNELIADEKTNKNQDHAELDGSEEAKTCSIIKQTNEKQRIQRLWIQAQARWVKK